MAIKNGFTEEVKPFVLVHFNGNGLRLLRAWAFMGLGFYGLVGRVCPENSYLKCCVPTVRI